MLSLEKNAIKKSKIDFLIVTMIISQLFIPSELHVLICTFLIAVDIFTHKSMPKDKANLWLLALIFLFCFIMSFFNSQNISFREIFRFFFYVFTPIIYIYYGELYILRKKQYASLLKSVFFSGVLLAGVHLCRLILVILQKHALTFSDMSELLPGYALIFSIMIFILYRDDIIFSKRKDLIGVIICLISFLLSVSRTYILIICVFWTCYFFYNHKIMSRNIKYIFIILFALISFYFYAEITSNEVVNYFMEKILNVFSETSSKSSWNEESIVLNWRGYENFMAIKQFTSSTFAQQLFGAGAKGVYAGRYAQLVTGTGEYLPVLHNGYLEILNSSGVVGLIMYVVFLIRNLIILVKCRLIRHSNIGIILITNITQLFLTTIVVTGLIVGDVDFSKCFLIGAGVMIIRGVYIYEGRSCNTKL